MLVCLVFAVSCAPRSIPQTKIPAPPSAMERQVRNAVDAGEGDYLVRSQQARLAADPDNLALRMELARHYLDSGSPELAVEHYRLAAARFPASAELQQVIAKTLRSMGLRAEAARGLETFLSAHPQPAPDLESWLGILRDEMGQWPAGEAAHRAALALAPDSDSLHNNLGYNLLMQGKKDEAAREFQRSLQLNPRSVVARNNLGLATVSQPKEAVASWQSVSDPATAHTNLAAMYIEQGRYAEARKELDIALGYNRYHVAALHNLRLVSELDGKPPTLPGQTAEKTWHKVTTALRHAFITEDEPRSGVSPAPADTRKGL
jgi:tetratricopeptide (TPR) repeat protein